MFHRTKLWKVYTIFQILVIIFWTEARTLPLPLYFRPSGSRVAPLQWPNLQHPIKSRLQVFPLAPPFTQNPYRHLNLNPLIPIPIPTTARKINKTSSLYSKSNSSLTYPRLRIYSNSKQDETKTDNQQVERERNLKDQLETKDNINFNINGNEPPRISKRCFGFDCQLSEWPTFPSFGSLSDTFSPFGPKPPDKMSSPFFGAGSAPGSSSSSWFDFESPSPPSQSFGSYMNPGPLPPPPFFMQQNQENFNIPPPRPPSSSYSMNMNNFNPGESSYYSGPGLLNMWNVLANVMDLAYNVYVHTKVGVGNHENPNQNPHVIENNPNENENDHNDNINDNNNNNDYSSNYNNYDHYFDYGGNSNGNNDYDYDSSHHTDNNNNYDYGNYPDSPDSSFQHSDSDSSDFGSSHSSHDYDY